MKVTGLFIYKESEIMATVAQTKQDVENMTRKDRLWDSLNHAYGQQREDSNRSYDQAISQADRRALSRGMQRSSYNSQVLGNLNNQKIKAQENSWNNQIADYENRLGQLESEEAEADRWEREFAANREDTAWNQNFQITQADRAADQWERQFNQGNNDTDRQLAASYVANIVANGGIPSDDLLARAGLSRADAELMAKGKGSSGGGYTPTPKPTEEPAADDDGSSLFDRFRNNRDNPPQNTTKVTIDEDKVKSWVFKNTSKEENNLSDTVNSSIISNYADPARWPQSAPATSNTVSQTAEERFGNTKKRDKNYVDATWSKYGVF